MLEVQEFRDRAMRTLTAEKGVYALCDLDKLPIYIGQSKDGIRTRVRRHLTSARSDVIANRHLDVWEVAEVWAWEVPIDNSIINSLQAQNAAIDVLENELIQHYNAQNALVNGKLPDFSTLGNSKPPLPHQKVEVLDDMVRNSRLEPINRMPRQASQLRDLIDYTIQVKNNSEQRRVLKVHYGRLSNYYKKFMQASNETDFEP